MEGREGEERERENGWLPPACTLTRDQTHNLARYHD